jgi:hypothetical protein
MMSKEITDVELQWAIEKIGERDKQISGLISKNIALREELQANISLRDHFAGLAMQSFYLSGVKWKPTGAERDEESVLLIKRLACDAYQMADAMLAEREKKDDSI